MANDNLHTEFTANEKQFVDAINKIIASTKNMEAAILNADRNTDKATRDIADSLKNIKSAMDNVEKSAKTFQGTMEGSMSKAAAVGSFLGNVFAVAAANVIQATLQIISKNVEMLGTFADISDSLNISVQKLQLYALTAQGAGVAFETLSGAMYKLEKATQAAREGQESQAEAFNKLNINAEKFSQLSMDDQITVMFEALSTVTDETERNSLAMEILGKSWKDLAPLAQNFAAQTAEMKKKLDDAGLSLSNLDVANIENLDGAMDGLVATTDAAAQKLIAIFAPGMESFANLLANDVIPRVVELASQTSHLTGLIAEQTKYILQELTPAWESFGKSVEPILDRIKEKMLTSGNTLLQVLALAPTMLQQAVEEGNKVLTPPTIKGSQQDVKAYAAQRLGQEGFGAAGVAGVISNLYYESGLNAENVNPTSGAYGLAQWLGSRKTELAAYAKSVGKSADDFRVQVDFIIAELTGKGATQQLSAAQLKRLRETSDPVEASNIILDYYERPSDAEKASLKGGRAPRSLMAKSVFYDITGKDGSTTAPTQASVAGQNTIKSEEERKQKEAEAIRKKIAEMRVESTTATELFNVYKTQGVEAFEQLKIQREAENEARRAGLKEGSEEYKQYVSLAVEKKKAEQATQTAIAADKKEEEAKRRKAEEAERLAEKLQKVVEASKEEVAISEQVVAASKLSAQAYRDKRAEMEATAYAGKYAKPGTPEFEALKSDRMTISQNNSESNLNQYQIGLELQRDNQLQLNQALNGGYESYQRMIRAQQIEAQIRQQSVGLTKEDIQARIAKAQAIDDETAVLEKQNSLAAQHAQNNRSFADMANEALAGSTNILTTAGQFDMLQQAISGATDQLVNFVMTGQGSFQQFAVSFIQMITKMIAQALIFSAVMSAIGMSGGAAGGAAGASAGARGTMVAAKGAVFGFAKGGAFTNSIVSSPTFFKFANGGGFANGVMGEAGPEAVMPLTRDGQGRLGVRAQGGGTTQFNNSFIINVQQPQGGSPQEAQKFGEAINKAVEVKVTEIMARQTRQYGGVSSGPSRMLTANS